jgi:hypothetical protein
MIDQEAIVLYLDRKGMNATAMHSDLFITLGLDSASYPTVTRILREMLATHE